MLVVSCSSILLIFVVSYSSIVVLFGCGIVMLLSIVLLLSIVSCTSITSSFSLLLVLAERPPKTASLHHL